MVAFFEAPKYFHCNAIKFKAALSIAQRTIFGTTIVARFKAYLGILGCGAIKNGAAFADVNGGLGVREDSFNE